MKTKILKYKYIYFTDNGIYEASVPTSSMNLVRVAYTKSIRHAAVVRNRVGRRLWGKYWNAVLSGYIRTVNSKTLAVMTAKRGDAWLVKHRDLITNKQYSKSFSCKKLGEDLAKSSAEDFACKTIKQRSKQLAEWDRKIIRVPRR